MSTTQKSVSPKRNTSQKELEDDDYVLKDGDPTKEEKCNIMEDDYYLGEHSKQCYTQTSIDATDNGIFTTYDVEVPEKGVDNVLNRKVDPPQKVPENFATEADSLDDFSTCEKMNSVKDEEDMWDKECAEMGTPVDTRKIMRRYVWKCSTCDEEVSSLSNLKSHHLVTHNQEPNFKCVDCGKIYTRYRSFIRHVKLHWNRECFRCNICGKEFALKDVLQSHMIVHSDERRFVCAKCGKSFKQYSSLYLHNKSHLPQETKTKFQCTICTKVFNTKHSMDSHTKTHTGERNFICDICGKRFFTKGSLDTHITTHNSIRSHPCSICNKSFKTAHLLSKHAKLHTGLKPHHCDVCGKQFRERSTLKEHSRVHTGDMPYSCEFCGKLFRFKGILTIHRRQHTGERPYQCTICNREFTNWSNYNKHRKRRHKPGSDVESDNEVINFPHQQPDQQLLFVELQQNSITSYKYQENPTVMTTNLSVTSTSTVQDTFSLEPSLYDNLSLDLADEQLPDFCKFTTALSHPTSSLPISPIQLHYMHRSVICPEEFVPNLSSPVEVPDIKEIALHQS